MSGIAALAFSAAPTATAAQVAQAIESTAVPIPGVVDGRVDAYAAVHAIAPSLDRDAGTVGTTGATEASPPDRPTRARLDVRGRLTSRHRRRAYIGANRDRRPERNVSVRSLGRPRVRLTVRLVAPNGAIVVSRSGVGQLRFEAAVDPMRYRLVVSRRGRDRRSPTGRRSSSQIRPSSTHQGGAHVSSHDSSAVTEPMSAALIGCAVGLLFATAATADSPQPITSARSPSPTES